MSVGWAQIHYKKGEFGHKNRCTQGEGHLKMNVDTWVSESSKSPGMSQIPCKPPEATRDTEQLSPSQLC